MSPNEQKRRFSIGSAANNEDVYSDLPSPHYRKNHDQSSGEGGSVMKKAGKAILGELSGVLNLLGIIFCLIGFYFTTNDTLKSHADFLTRLETSISKLGEDFRLLHREVNEIAKGQAVTDQKVDDLKEAVKQRGGR